MDKLTPEQRRKNMQAVKSKGSKIELLFGKALWNLGYRYRKNDKTVFGKPDFTFKQQKIAIFCDGEFWHGRNWNEQKKEVKSHKKFWINKIENNIKRDNEVNAELKRQGWRVLRFWETDIEKNLCSCIEQITNIMAKKQKTRIDINEVYNGKEFKVQIYGKHSLKKNGTIIPFEEQLAVISHYLHNINTESEKPYKKLAKGLIEDIYQLKFNEATNANKVAESPIQYNFFPDVFSVPFPAPENPKFTFIDLFAGIGGFRIALQNLGGKCVYSSEWDEQAKKTYLTNFGEVPFGDITKEETKLYIPDNFDVLCAGFPCQAFSLAGKRLGFEETRGTLFFDVADIIRRKQPKAFFLENVKGLKIHDKGRTLQVILNTLRELGYYVPDPQVLNAMNFGVPQHRERIYIVGFRKDLGIKDFEYPTPTDDTKRFIDIKEKKVVSVKYYLSTQYLKTLIAHKKRHESKGNGFGYEIIPDDHVSNAIVVGGMGRERNLVIDNRLKDFTPVTKIKGEVNREGIRRMTPREWARLQGFPDDFIIAVADASAYKQFGNSVAVPAIQATAKKIVEIILTNKIKKYGTIKQGRNNNTKTNTSRNAV